MNKYVNQPTGLRHWIHEHPVVGVCIATAVLVLSGAVLVAAITPPKRGIAGAYYFDLATGSLFVSPVSQLTPIVPPGPDGGANTSGEATGVRAYVYSCGDCSKEDQRTIGWLEMYNPDVLKRAGHDDSYQPPSGFTIMKLEENPVGVLVAKVPPTPTDKPQWMPIRSSQGNELTSAARRCDDGSAATRCEP